MSGRVHSMTLAERRAGATAVARPRDQPEHLVQATQAREREAAILAAVAPMPCSTGWNAAAISIGRRRRMRSWRGSWRINNGTGFIRSRFQVRAVAKITFSSQKRSSRPHLTISR